MRTETRGAESGLFHGVHLHGEADASVSHALSLPSKHTGNDMLLMGAIPANLYLRALTETGGEECGLPCTNILFSQRPVIMAYIF